MRQIPVFHLVGQIQIVMNRVGRVHDLYFVSGQMVIQHERGQQADASAMLDCHQHTVQIRYDVCRMRLWTLLEMLAPKTADDRQIQIIADPWLGA